MNNVRAKKLEVCFYQTETGTEPIRDWLKELTKSDKQLIGEAIKTVQYGWPLGMPLVAHLETSLWEVRIKLSGNRIARVIFFMDGNIMILVNGFMKKTQKIPQQELELAKKESNTMNYTKYEA